MFGSRSASYGEGGRLALALACAEGGLMRLMGWTDTSMLDRCVEDLQVQWAIEARRRRGNIY